MTEAPPQKEFQIDLITLIHEVHARPPLWNPHVISGKETTERLWWEVADLFETTDRIVKAKFKRLKDGFRRELKRTIEQPGFNPVWPYYDMMQFLRDIFLNSKRISFGSDEVFFSNNSLQGEAESISRSDVQQADYEVVVVSEQETIFSPKRKRQTDEDDRKENSASSTSGSYAKMSTNGTAKHPSALKVNAVPKPEMNPEGASTSENDAYSEIKESILSKKKVDATVKEQKEIPPPDSSSKPHTSWGCCSVDEDIHFFMSLVPHMKSFDSLQKLRIRNRIQQVLIEEISKGFTRDRDMESEK